MNWEPDSRVRACCGELIARVLSRRIRDQTMFKTFRIASALRSRILPDSAPYIAFTLRMS